MRGKKRTGKSAGVKAGSWRHHFWREGGDLESHIPWMLDDEEKKEAGSKKLRVMRTKRVTKSEDTSHLPPL